MRIQIISAVFCILLSIVQVYGSPGHNIHDYYKCNSDYARRNYRHCRNSGQAESRNFGRVGRGIEHYNAAHSIQPSTITVLASVVLGMYEFMRH